MVFTIELSLYKNNSNQINYNIERREQAELFNCKMQYFIHEIEGIRHNITHNDCIHTVIFELTDFENLINYIKTVRQEKFYYIECVYKDEFGCDILYVSPRYLKKLNKNSAKTIKYNMDKLVDKHKIDIYNAVKVK
tara:strand:+ start:410 stop:817 length:408 start_codon:yes stop_codon:yes gene_type:complete